MSKTTLTEIKKGQTGTGLLIEQDGFVSLDFKNNKQLCESIVVDDATGRKELPNPFIVYAVFQKYGIENANGRVYPEDILKREIEKYQQAIRERRAFGECYPPDVEILTEKDGWKPITDVSLGENIFTLNTDTNGVEIKPIIRKIEYQYEDDMIRIEGNKINDLVTPNHKFPIYNKRSEFVKFITASELYDAVNNGKETPVLENYIPVSIGLISDGELISNLVVNKEKYDGSVVCIEVENHTWFVRSNGLTHWTGNCNHPSESVIDLERICMNVIELHWEGRTLVGQMEIPITEGFRKFGMITCLADHIAHLILSGLKIGVSSRALGSVKQSGGVLLVQPDLELVAFDVVATPSTNLAYISDNEEVIQQYVETKTGDDTKLMTEDKYSKFDNWLND